MEHHEAYQVMDLKALRCFWAVDKRGTLTGAGIELGISEPAVSKRVRWLESYLGTKLYQSRGGKVRLTPAGQQVSEMAAGLFDQLDEFQQGLTQERVTGTVTIAAEDPVQLYLLPPIVERYRRLFPNVKLQLLTRTVSQTVDLVRRNEVDIAILADGEFPEGLAFHPWRTFEAYCIMPLGHPLVRGAKRDFHLVLDRETILSYPLIVAEGQDQRLRNALSARGLPFNVALAVGSFDGVKRYVSLGFGVGVVAGLCLTEDDHARLATVEIPAEYEGQTTYGVLIGRRKYIDAPLKGLLPLMGVSLD